MYPFVTLAAYRYVALSGLKDRRSVLLSLCRTWSLKGSITLSPEGISVHVAGEAHAVQMLLDALRQWPPLGDLRARISGSEQQPFVRMIVRVKHELVAFGVPEIDPARNAAPGIHPRELQRRLTAGDPMVLLDARNAYEWARGSFKGALKLDIEHFQDFPQKVTALALDRSGGPLVVFCTTGMRSAKASSFLRWQGFRQVSYLEGGILDYLEQCAGEHYDAECVAFDRHQLIDAGASQAQWDECLQCRHPLTAQDRQQPTYSAGHACPYCHEPGPAELATRLSARNARIADLIDPLPGSTPQDHFRPVSIPANCDGLSLLDALSRIVPHIPSRYWQERCDQGLILSTAGISVPSSHRVRAGERYLHRFPGVVEPDVDMRIEVLHEDEALVVINKPAPLPMHAGGRFVRNTLKHVLDALYHPQQPRPAHRLDANTTGIIVAARTKFFAGKLQVQFARGEVEKHYLVRVHGHPDQDEFKCEARISADAGHAGSRVVDESGLTARTDFTVLRRLSDGTSLLEARPLTGRTNQIRVHLWHVGLPICGDSVYLRDAELGDAQTLPLDAAPLSLHASRIRFRHPLRRQFCEFQAPDPSWFRQAMAAETEDQRDDSIIAPST